MTDFNSVREDLEREIYLAEEVEAQYAVKVPVDLLKDILNLLENQDEALKHLRILLNMHNGSEEPHVMTLEEARRALHNEDFIIVEEPHTKEIILGMRDTYKWDLTDGSYFDFNDLDMGSDYADCKGYGHLFRFWTSRPTEEQRKAVKWNG